MSLVHLLCNQCCCYVSVEVDARSFPLDLLVKFCPAQCCLGGWGQWPESFETNTIGSVSSSVEPFCQAKDFGTCKTGQVRQDHLCPCLEADDTYAEAP